MVKLKRNYTDTSQFDNGILPYGKAFATSLQWLYDDDEFNDETISEEEYDSNCLYYMNGVLPICDFMSVVTDIIYLAFQDFGEPNIKNYINLIEKDYVIMSYSEPVLRYDGEYMILGKVKPSTTEVILWSAYLYSHLRKEFEPQNEKVVRADKLLFKLYAQKTCLKPELVKGTFLMKRFNKTILVFLKNIPTHNSEQEEKIAQDNAPNPEMEESVLDKIPANNIANYYEGWRNGKKGGFVQEHGIYRFYEMAYNKGGMLDDVYPNQPEKNPITAVGIVAYWLMFNSKKELVLKRLTQYRNGIPQNIREEFDNYTKERFNQFKAEHRDDPFTLDEDWDWEYEFYTKYIIPHEIKLNKKSEALFDYISDSDINLVQAVMNYYIKYLKKRRSEKGYRVSPELLVLRAVDSRDNTKYEDLEEYEVNNILEKLEGEGFIKVAWIEGHKPEGTRMLDKGRAYLKHLEEGVPSEISNHSGKRGQNRKLKGISHPPKYMTLKYVTHGANKELVKRQRDRVKLLFEKWKTPEMKLPDGGWGWLDASIASKDFCDLFEGNDRCCNLKINRGKPNVVTVFFTRLLKYIPEGKKETLIEVQTKQSAPQIMLEQFGVNAINNLKRLSPTDIKRLKESIYILDWNAPLPLKQGGGDTNYDLSDTALQLYSAYIDLGINQDADVEQAIKSGVLRKGKHT